MIKDFISQLLSGGHFELRVVPEHTLVYLYPKGVQEPESEKLHYMLNTSWFPVSRGLTVADAVRRLNVKLGSQGFDKRTTLAGLSLFAGICQYSTISEITEMLSRMNLSCGDCVHLGFRDEPVMISSRAYDRSLIDANNDRYLQLPDELATLLISFNTKSHPSLLEMLIYDQRNILPTNPEHTHAIVYSEVDLLDYRDTNLVLPSESFSNILLEQETVHLPSLIDSMASGDAMVVTATHVIAFSFKDDEYTLFASHYTC